MTGTRPSDLTDIEDRWTALQFDNAVRYVGTVIENALQEKIETGAGKNRKFVDKYTLEQLLDPDFRFPEPKSQKGIKAFVDNVKRAGYSNIKYVKVK